MRSLPLLCLVAFSLVVPQGCATRESVSEATTEALPEPPAMSWMGYLPSTRQILFAPGTLKGEEREAFDLFPLIGVDENTGRAAKIKRAGFGLVDGVVAQAQGFAVFGYSEVETDPQSGLRKYTAGSDTLVDLPSPGPVERAMSGWWGFVLSQDERRLAGLWCVGQARANNSERPKPWTPSNWNTEVVLVDLPQGKIHRTGVREASPLCWSADGNNVFCSTARGIKAIAFHTHAVSSVSSRTDIVRAFHSERLRGIVAIAPRRDRGSIELVDEEFTTQRVLARYPNGVVAFALSPGGSFLAFRDKTGKNGVVDLTDGHIIHFKGLLGNMGPVWQSEDTLLVGDSRGTVTFAGADGDAKRTLHIAGLSRNASDE